ncbi:MAG: hypothetical protein HYZ27_10025, partial [Deltaproteobacteria bacterium]|nr:hypothetical protein [Deltaproteobacteria bacterium]
HAPSFSFWSLYESVETLDHRAHFKGQLGVDTGLFMAAPESGRWFTDFFTHTECEGIVRARGFSGEKQVLARFDGVKGQGLLAVLFPRLAGEPRPEFQTRAGGFQIRWKDETHYVLLETAERSVEDAGLEATASCLVAKMRDKKHFTLCLPAGGKARYVGKKLASDGPAEIAVVDGKKQRAEGRDLRRRQQSRNFNRELTMAGLGAPRYFAAPISRSHSIAAGSHFMTGANVVEETPRRPLPVAAPAAILAAAKRFRSPARHIRWLFES